MIRAYSLGPAPRIFRSQTPLMPIAASHRQLRIAEMTSS